MDCNELLKQCSVDPLSVDPCCILLLVMEPVEKDAGMLACWPRVLMHINATY